VKAKVVRVKAKVLRVMGELEGVACNAPCVNRKDASRSYKEAGRRERQRDTKHIRSNTAATPTITSAPWYATILLHEYLIY
jgi:hypothetical protein